MPESRKSSTNARMSHAPGHTTPRRSAMTRGPVWRFVVERWDIMVMSGDRVAAAMRAAFALWCRSRKAARGGPHRDSRVDRARLLMSTIARQELEPQRSQRNTEERIALLRIPL